MYAYPFLLKYFRFAKSKSAHNQDDASTAHDYLKPLAHIGAIGPVTSNYLEEELMLCVDAVASEPTPEGLLAAIFGGRPAEGEI